MSTPGAAMEEYQYAPLQSEGQIRVMHLEPAFHFNDDIRCSLHLAAVGTARYEALSYAWGDGTKKGRILLGDKYLEITDNLDVALRYIRTRRTPRMLWVDAVCINQSDVLERNSQVQLMGQIYKCSLHGLIWLEDADDGVSRLFRALKAYEMLFTKAGDHSERSTWRRIGERTLGRRIWRRIGERTLWSRFVLDTLLRAGTKDESFNQLCRRPWFSRVWTLQEVILPPQSLVQSGSRVLNWTTLSDLQCALQSGRTGGFLHWEPGSRFTFQLNRAAQGFWDTKFMECLVVVKKLSATNPRDKVYGCAALFAREGWQSPTPDYKMSTVNVYIAATRSWISLLGRLNVLGLAATAHYLPGLPSWVIDWSQEHGNEQAFTRLLWYSRRLSATRDDALQSSGIVDPLHVEHELALCGTPVAVVQSTSVCLWHRTDPATRDAIEPIFSPSWLLPANVRQSLFKTAVSWVSTIRRSSDERGFRLLLERLAHLIQQSTSLMLPIPGSIRIFDRVHAFLRNIDDSNTRLADGDTFDEAQGPTHPDRLAEMPFGLIDFIQHTNLIITDTDEVGLCFCSHVYQGDVVVLAAGSDLPLVLRPVAGKEGYFTLAGPAWVSNMMEGELWPEKADRDTLSTMILV